jgi:hypothetical protein
MEAQELLRIVYAAFNARNIDAVLALMHNDVDWPNGMEGGRMCGHNSVRDYWTRQWTLINPHVEPLRFEVDDAGRVVVDVHAVVRDLNGNLLSERDIQHVYSIRDGLIERMDIRS